MDHGMDHDGRQGQALPLRLCFIPNPGKSPPTLSFIGPSAGRQAGGLRERGDLFVNAEYNRSMQEMFCGANKIDTDYTYNADGQRVKSIINNETIYFVGGYYEFNDTTNEVTKYYFAGASRIAMQKYIVPQSTTLTYLLGDHLGSTSLAVDADTGDVVETRYKPCPSRMLREGGEML